MAMSAHHDGVGQRWKTEQLHFRIVKPKNDVLVTYQYRILFSGRWRRRARGPC
jgi:hypothetical protein